jgi:hypothetical protein
MPAGFLVLYSEFARNAGVRSDDDQLRTKTYDHRPGLQHLGKLEHFTFAYRINHTDCFLLAVAQYKYSMCDGMSGDVGYPKYSPGGKEASFRSSVRCDINLDENKFLNSLDCWIVYD